MSEIRVDAADEILIDISSEISEKDKPKSSIPTEMTSSSDALHQIYVTETVPPQANSISSSSDDMESSSSCFAHCLCCCDADGQQISQQPQGERRCVYGTKTLRKILSNGLCYLYVLITTFLLVLMILAELLLDLDLLRGPDSEGTSVDAESTNSESVEPKPGTISASLALHWTIFSLLCIFFIEVILRFYAWKVHIARSIVAVVDSAVVTVSLACHLAATLAAGYQSPFDAISLIIFFRFIRLYSLVQYYITNTKRTYRSKLAKVESCQAEMQILNQRLTRQILDKDFEIKQLHAHLGDGDDCDPEFQQTLQKAKLNLPKKSSYESDLEKALALSKRAYEEETGTELGIDNPGYHSTPERLRARDSLPSIVVHHREDSIRRSKRDQPSTSHTQIDDYLTSQRPDVTPTSHLNVITHGQLHSEGDMTSSGDMTSLLEPSTTTNNADQTWTVGYCLLQDGAPPVDVIRSDGTAKACDVTASDSDEGIGSVTSSAMLTEGNHSRTTTSVSIATEIGSSYSESDSTIVEERTASKRDNASNVVTSCHTDPEEDSSKL